MKKHLQAAKMMAATLLLLSFFLPMSSCSYTVSPRPGEVETRVVLNYPREYVDPGEIGAWLNVLAFAWPFPFLLLQGRFWGRRFTFLFSVGGVCLSVLSAVAVYTWADIGKPLIGAWVGGGAAVALFIVYVVESAGYLRGRRSGELKVEGGK